MPRHEFTPEEIAKGVKNRKASGKRFLKEFKALTGTKMRSEVIVTLLSNPAVVGSLLYLGVGLLRTPNGGINTSGLPSWLKDLLNWKSPLALPGSQTTGQTIGEVVNVFDNLGIDALQVALLAYIASGGNLSGTLQAGSSLVSKIAPLLAGVAE